MQAVQASPYRPPVPSPPPYPSSPPFRLGPWLLFTCMLPYFVATGLQDTYFKLGLIIASALAGFHVVIMGLGMYLMKQRKVYPYILEVIFVVMYPIMCGLAYADDDVMNTMQRYYNFIVLSTLAGISFISIIITYPLGLAHIQELAPWPCSSHEDVIRLGSQTTTLFCITCIALDLMYIWPIARGVENQHNHILNLLFRLILPEVLMGLAILLMRFWPGSQLSYLWLEVQDSCQWEKGIEIIDRRCPRILDDAMFAPPMKSAVNPYDVPQHKPNKYAYNTTQQQQPQGQAPQGQQAPQGHPRPQAGQPTALSYPQHPAPVQQMYGSGPVQVGTGGAPQGQQPPQKGPGGPVPPQAQLYNSGLLPPGAAMSPQQGVQQGVQQQGGMYPLGGPGFPQQAQMGQAGAQPGLHAGPGLYNNPTFLIPAARQNPTYIEQDTPMMAGQNAGAMPWVGQDPQGQLNYGAPPRLDGGPGGYGPPDAGQAWVNAVNAKNSPSAPPVGSGYGPVPPSQPGYGAPQPYQPQQPQQPPGGGGAGYYPALPKPGVGGGYAYEPVGGAGGSGYGQQLPSQQQQPGYGPAAPTYLTAPGGHGPGPGGANVGGVPPKPGMVQGGALQSSLGGSGSYNIPVYR